ncbi:hypothetical protein Cgig2_004820 [Carnegiea gigantea]|uniref:Uncharacterized protein n=1 Tax=Carnegiea gigantea TaxID=171969 RepID=A0A9Q1KWU3_9CARY|nr:hypothetical protein Cgig2_004820 [Carnegiea gigantea]
MEMKFFRPLLDMKMSFIFARNVGKSGIENRHLLEQKYTQFECGQIPMIHSYRSRYFPNRIRAFPSTPNFLTSRVDLLGPGSPDYGPAPVYGYGEGPLEGDISSDSRDGGTTARSPSQFKYSASCQRTDVGPSRRAGGRSPSPCSSNSVPPLQGYYGHALHEHPTLFHTQGPTNHCTDLSFPYNPYSRPWGAYTALPINTSSPSIIGNDGARDEIPTSLLE